MPFIAAAAAAASHAKSSARLMHYVSELERHAIPPKDIPPRYSLLAI